MYQGIAFRTAWLVAGNTADAEEAAQDGFVKAYRALWRFRAGAPVKPWLLPILTNEARHPRPAPRRPHAPAPRASRGGVSRGAGPPPPAAPPHGADGGAHPPPRRRPPRRAGAARVRGGRLGGRGPVPRDGAPRRDAARRAARRREPARGAPPARHRVPLLPRADRGGDRGRA